MKIVQNSVAALMFLAVMGTIVYMFLLAMSSDAYALDLKRTHPNHMSGSGSSLSSRGYIPRQKNCNGNTYIVKKYLDEELEPLKGSDAIKWCEYFHSNTCSLPTVAFVPDRNSPENVSRRDNRPNKTLQYSLKWFQSTSAEVFVMYPGYSGCKVFTRKGGPKFRGGAPKND